MDSNAGGLVGFGEIYCLQVSIWKQYDPPEHFYILVPVSSHDITIYQTKSDIFTAVRTSNLLINPYLLSIHYHIPIPLKAIKLMNLKKSLLKNLRL